MVRKHQQSQEQKTEDENSNECNHLDDAEDEMLCTPEQPVMDHANDEGDEQDEVHNLKLENTGWWNNVQTNYGAWDVFSPRLYTEHF